jgi:hypothetical protein
VSQGASEGKHVPEETTMNPVAASQAIPADSTSRRAALALIGASAAAVWAGADLARAHAATTTPALATPEQIDAERRLLELLKDRDLRALQAQIRATLAATPRGRIPDAAARLDIAVAQWTNSLIFNELAGYRPTPGILWGTDDTPRVWLGHTLGGVGTSGDNPDNIYRGAAIDGGGRYEILGRIDLARRPAQFSFEASPGGGGVPAKLVNQGPGHADLGHQLAMITDRDLAIGPDGAFRITLGGAADVPNHIALTPGPMRIGIRDTLSDWNQRPNRLAIRRLDGAPPQLFDPAELRRRVLANLGGYIDFWSAFPDVWFGGLQPNSYAGPTPRDGGWGFLAGVRYRLAPGEAILVTTGSGDARYTGAQVVDPWMIASDARGRQTSLNLSQATPNADGGFSYVIASTDPGTANWLDTDGLQEGFALFRWQALPSGATKQGLLRDFRVIQLSDAASLGGLPRVTPQERRLQVAARAAGYANRLL